MRREERTERAVRQQLAAMGVDLFEVGVRDGDGRMRPLTLTGEGILRRLGWLKAQNAAGSDIYVRTAGSHGVLLVDDLDKSALGRLHGGGYRPAAVVETSPGNYQAWVRVAAGSLHPAVATAAARILAADYGGDPAAARWRQYGRLAGFTNRKPRHRQADGRYPYVLLHAAPGGLAPAAGTLLEQARHAAAARTEPADDACIAVPVPPFLGQGPPVSALGRLYAAEVERLRRRYPVPDWHRIDWMVLTDIVRRHPQVSAAELAQAMYTASPHLAERKRGHVDHYVGLTVGAVLRAARRPGEEAVGDAGGGDEEDGR